MPTNHPKTGIDKQIPKITQDNIILPINSINPVFAPQYRIMQKIRNPNTPILTPPLKKASQPCYDA